MPHAAIATIFDFMEERERIRQIRAAGQPWPWTDDPVLQTYSFTNVMREYDAVSIWIQENIIDKYINHPQLWLLLALARQINWPPSLQVALDALAINETGGKIDDASMRQVRAVLDDFQARGNKVYTGAYMIHADSDRRTADWWINKNHYVLDMVVGQLVGRTPPLYSMRVFTKWMTQFESWGGFMGYEVACDLRWAPGWLDEAPDIRTWANPGPGAYRGLNWVHSRPVKPNVSEAQAIVEMRSLLRKAEGHPWEIEWPRPFEMRDIEHTLCEWDKYQRTVHGLGKPRSKYKLKSNIAPTARPATIGGDRVFG